MPFPALRGSDLRSPPSPQGSRLCWKQGKHSTFASGFVRLTSAVVVGKLAVLFLCVTFCAVPVFRIVLFLRAGFLFFVALFCTLHHGSTMEISQDHYRMEIFFLCVVFRSRNNVRQCPNCPVGHFGFLPCFCYGFHDNIFMFCHLLKLCHLLRSYIIFSRNFSLCFGIFVLYDNFATRVLIPVVTARCFRYLFQHRTDFYLGKCYVLPF